VLTAHKRNLLTLPEKADSMPVNDNDGQIGRATIAEPD
jgi:hypothetical protein